MVNHRFQEQERDFNYNSLILNSTNTDNNNCVFYKHCDRITDTEKFLLKSNTEWTTIIGDAVPMVLLYRSLMHVL